MADTIQKFFDGELNDAEWEGLLAELELSETAAWRFSELAIARYRSFGMGRRRPRLRGLLWPLAAMGAAWAAYAAFGPSAATERPGLGLSAGAFDSDSGSPRPEARAARAPRNSRPESSEGDRLRVGLSLERSEMATVEVLDSGGRRVRRIYSGLLKAGDWAFYWDGKLDNLNKAAPGEYSIVLRAKGLQQSKNVRIE